MISGVAGLRPNFFLQRPNFLAELAQESWRDLAAVAEAQGHSTEAGGGSSAAASVPPVLGS
jgi:hypothetical protein